MYNIFQNYKSTLILLIKLLLVGGAYFFISQKIKNNDLLYNNEFLTGLGRRIFDKPFTLFIIFLFTFINWFLEIIKWQTLVSSIKKISFYEALEQSLSSLTASLLTPNRIGEYGAKTLYYSKYERVKILFLNLLGNINQMLVTVLFGLFGLLFLINFLTFPITFTNLYFYGSLGLLILVLLISLNKFGKRTLQKMMTPIREIKAKIYFKTFYYSFFRYLIFSHQFYFLLFLFGAGLDYSDAMPIIFTMYLLASVIPSFVFFDWLIKGSVAISLFSVFHINEMLILSITSIMWMANFALPSIIGSYFVLTFTKFVNPDLKENTISP